MPISFDTISLDLRVPGAFVEIDATRAARGVAALPHRVLLIGQRAAASAVAALVPTLITRPDDGILYFGRGSMLASMVTAFRLANPSTECYAIALDDLVAGVAATGNLTVTAVPATAGTINLYVAGTRLRVGYAGAATPATVATAIVTAVNGNLDLPVTAVVDGVNPAKVNLTCRWKGDTGNDIDLRLDYRPDERSGVTVTIVAMAGGTGNPDVGTILPTWADRWFTEIVSPYTDTANLNALQTELERRYGAMVSQDGVVFACRAGTVGTLTTFGLARNGRLETIMGVNSSPMLPFIWAATTAAVAAFNLSIDPARPLQYLTLPGVLPPTIRNAFTLQERDLLLHDGIATWRVDESGLVQIERLITTYQRSQAGAADTGVSRRRDGVPTLAFIRNAERTRILTKFPRYKLVSDDFTVRPGQAIVRPRDIRNELIALAGELADRGIVEDLQGFRSDLLVERDPNDPNRINVLNPANLVNQFRVYASKIQFRLKGGELIDAQQSKPENRRRARHTRRHAARHRAGRQVYAARFFAQPGRGRPLDRLRPSARRRRSNAKSTTPAKRGSANSPTPTTSRSVRDRHGSKLRHAQRLARNLAGRTAGSGGKVPLKFVSDQAEEIT